MTGNPSKNLMSEQAAAPCPICGKPSEFVTRPFCSKRCADIDLHRWLGGVYAIPAAAEPEEETGSEDAAETS
ncbi:DNA gyrase inhibitor YacG [Methylocapsa sp. D3K7]|uniref:DNA gyrase inhibitor YacG n=1 Tax=Methylocapsa sp. D3K7 TaxID=3041435 RepID=UPI00244E77D2|nr:DNA gyrase inhibitor YacG [Methylocapsa sp. D3K7]WGJ15116.1 DNA gyrase inhibitor YacG [Methylocapsa sp. D3K7]